MEKRDILENLAKAILEGNREETREKAREALKSGIDPLEAVEQGLSKGMAIVGQRFDKGDAFLPELLMAANNFNAAMEVLKPEIEIQEKQVTKAGTVLIGTVKGDLHDIGKNIVATVLGIHGFEVVDMGVDIPSLNIIQQAEKVKADVIALSSLMTTTLSAQKEVIEMLNEMKLRKKYFVIVGGGPVKQEWADKIGADGYGRSAVQAVEIVKKLLREKG